MPTATERLPCIGLVLAGGRSTRMGRDKAMLDWRGQPLIERQLDVLRASGVDGLRVSGDRPGYQCVADAQPGLGPLGGLAGIAETQAGDADLLVIPVDMPLLGAALLRRLRTEQAQARGLRCADHVLPMRLRLDAESRARIAGLLQEPEPRQRSLRALQQAMGFAEIALAPDEHAQLADCNTEASWNEVNR
ncbi:NTP transferase domain-containing protein [Rhodanobacter sp. PCA2]|uniref:molybdenum cofactor guanylyltransferase n=1 Tax=Rhodanobacter sp. PCA2 TaxID=2006117 RepID=UPI0015E70C08|nr:NTP transferase domain-containing protein [Rhodanobacter sp. PCA2]MBA2078311.1 molybdenum cofactor guanylyltransferase [Rhodanobacter sp. PCA2]